MGIVLSEVKAGVVSVAEELGVHEDVETRLDDVED